MQDEKTVADSTYLDGPTVVMSRNPAAELTLLRRARSARPLSGASGLDERVHQSAAGSPQGWRWLVLLTGVVVVVAVSLARGPIALRQLAAGLARPQAALAPPRRAAPTAIPTMANARSKPAPIPRQPPPSPAGAKAGASTALESSAWPPAPRASDPAAAAPVPSDLGPVEPAPPGAIALTKQPRLAAARRHSLDRLRALSLNDAIASAEDLLSRRH
jgi:hypothetical protein